MIRKVIRIIGILLLIGGIFVLYYPTFRQWQYDQKVDGIIERYEKRIKESNQNDELYRKIQEYNKNLFETGQKDLVDPFSYEQVRFSLKPYGFHEDMIGYLKIPKIKLCLPIYLGATLENMEKGAAHLTQTSIPIGGMNTNAVLAAHSGWTDAAMFNDIMKLEPGDKVYVRNFRETLTYQVVQSTIILPTDIEKILIQPKKDMITLITCYPIGKSYQRYVVYCERVEKSK